MKCGLCKSMIYGDPVVLKGHPYHVSCATRRAHEVGPVAMEQLKAALQARAAARPETRTGRRAFVNPRTGEGVAPTRVVHRRDPHDVYIGRGSDWGNPATHLPIEGTRAQVQVGSREEAVAAYLAKLRLSPALVTRARRELRGKVLGCFCSPKACHGDVLAAVADGILDPANEQACNAWLDERFGPGWVAAHPNWSSIGHR